jgi:pimeloyl-ACP methyl ester carboxylesterase
VLSHRPCLEEIAMNYSFATTPLLDVGYLEWNPSGKRTAVLVHGWPDSPEGWRGVAGHLADAGYRVLCPALRGFGPTRFRHAQTPRSGQLSALGRDLLEFLKALGLNQPILIGHDWGARAVANACGLDDRAASHLVMLSPDAELHASAQLLVPLVHGHAARRTRDRRGSTTLHAPDVGYVVSRRLVHRS